jgi:hypothetical protein
MSPMKYGMAAWRKKPMYSKRGINKIIFFIDQPLSEWNCERFQIREITKIYDTLVIDISDLVHPGKKHPEVASYSDIEIIKVNSFISLIRCIPWLMSSALILSMLGIPYERNRIIYILLQFFADKWIIFTISSFPTIKGLQGRYSLQRLKRKFAKDGLNIVHLLMVRFIYKLCAIFFIVKPAYFLSVGTYVTKSHGDLIGKKTKIVPSLSYDFRKFRTKMPDSSGKDYILFIDQQMYTHPDAQANGFNKAAEDNYLELLKRFLEKLQTLFGMPVIIAIHPRSDLGYQKKLKDKLPFRILKNTENLIPKSALCVGHSSTIFGIVSIFSKKALFITTNEMSKIHKEIDDLAYYFKVKAYNIEKNSLQSIEQLNGYVSQSDSGNKFVTEHLNYDQLNSQSLLEFLVCNYPDYKK